ncbi:nucleotidyltransferase domain-containing protein [Alicyclobacillus mengziensis]|uniref:Nucleotidyltransferase domain-containing protein n=1 Tax=Alicyclobacillus mengziensis TaxID=2931921 RepID=A0A9X7VYJ5_9BACL|nr:nucleotidyltransferase domain-containing protein [Alicyclobacillus mengziensis]QSO47424.1 nucleotidyltransferase domain-containing protein [Alicyclobacillus mengziensis]
MPEASSDSRKNNSKARNTDLGEPISSLVHILSQVSEIERVILFGSRARGDHEERSDIDLAVDAPNMEIAKWDETCLLMAENSKTLLAIDLIWLQRAPNRLVQRIQSEGVIVFERENQSIH